MEDLRVVAVGIANISPVGSRWERIEILTDKSRNFLDLLRARAEGAGDFGVVMLADLVQIVGHHFTRQRRHIHGFGKYLDLD